MNRLQLLTIFTIIALGSAYVVYAGVLPVVKAIPASVTVVRPVVVEVVGPEQILTGATVDYHIRADDVTGLAAAQTTFTYDPVLFTVDRIDLGPDFNGCLNAVNDDGQGTILLGLICSEGHTGAPLGLWVVTLGAAEVQEEHQTQLAANEVTLGDVNEQGIPALGSSRNVTISPIICGDVHPAGGGDGDDDILDALRKLKIAVGLVTPDERELIAGDVHPDNIGIPDGDGDIDVLDALRDLKSAVKLVTITSCGMRGGLSGIAAELAGGPGAIYTGDLAQLVGPAPTPDQGGLDGNVPLDALQRHLFFYESDYYQHLLATARFESPTELVTSRESITIQHVCINRTLLPCKLFEFFYAPNVLARTNGQIQIQVSSFPESGLDGADVLALLADGTIDMANVYGGYIEGQLPAVAVGDLSGIYPSLEIEFQADTAILPDLEKLVLDAIGAGVVVNHSWFEGNDSFLFCNGELENVADFAGKKTRSHANSLSDWLEGMGADPVYVRFSQVYAELEQVNLDCAITGADPAFGQKWYEVATHMNGPLLSSSSVSNVINQSLWDSIPTDFQQILLEEGAKSELEALRLAAIQHEVGVQKNTDAGMILAEFSNEVQNHSFNGAAVQYVLPAWIIRVGGVGADILQVFNEKIGPLVGLFIKSDGTVELIP